MSIKTTTKSPLDTENPMPIAQARVISTRPNMANQPSADDEKILECYTYARTVKCLALIEGIFSALYLFYNFWYAFSIIFAIIGYIGAENYKFSMIRVYGIYLLVAMIARMALSIYVISQGWGDGFYIFFTILIVLIETWIVILVCKFAEHLKKLSERELDILQNTKIRAVVRYVYY
jgi:hypothetical protein